MAFGMDLLMLASMPYLISAEKLERLRDGTDDELDRFMLPHVRLLEGSFRESGQALLTLAGTSSLLARLDELSNRRSVAMARLKGLEASLLLAAGIGEVDARRAERRAREATDTARRTSASGTAEFVSEYEMVTAVALKAVGEIDASVQHSRTAARDLGTYELAVPLVRQEVLMRQERRSFEQLLDHAPNYSASRPREYYRTLKRAFEFELNQRDVRAAELMVPELLRAFGHCDRRGVLDRVSLLKNLAQLFGAMGQSRRALLVLDAASTVSHRAGFNGQRRQIDALRLSYAEGGTGRLESFELR